MTALAKLNSNGQLTIPKEILEDLKLAPGTEFTISIQDRSVLATPAIAMTTRARNLMDFAGILGKPPNGQSLLIEEIDDVLMDIAVEDDERIRREWHEGRK